MTARNPDYLAERFLDDPVMRSLDHPVVHALSKNFDDAMRDLEIAMHVRMMTVRTRFIDDSLRRAVSDGATQVVILGAGLDTYAYRHRELLAHVNVFELDRPATQFLKRERVQRVLGSPPRNLTYVEVDFNSESLADALTLRNYCLSQQTLFIAEGLAMYLPVETLRNILRFVGLHALRSGVVFDFVSRQPIRDVNSTQESGIGVSLNPIAERFFELTKDEPWVSWIPLGSERAFLRAFGLETRELLRIVGMESLRRYLMKADGSQIGSIALEGALRRNSAAATLRKRPIGPEAQERQSAATRKYQPLVAQIAEAFVDGTSWLGSN